MHENNKDIGWEKNYNNVGSDGNYDDTLIKNQISTLNNKVNEVSEEINALEEVIPTFVILTQEEYNALEVKDDYTFYGIKED